MGTGRRRPESSGSASFIRWADEIQSVTVALPGEGDRRHQVVEGDALLLRPLDLLHQAWHLGAGPSIEHPHLGAEATRGAGAVHGGVAAADHSAVGAQIR